MNKLAFLLATTTVIASKETLPKPDYTTNADTFKQFWDNLELCEGRLSLSKCLITTDSEYDFLREERTSDCTLNYVKDVCGQLQYDEYEVKITKDSDGNKVKTRVIDDGNIYVTEDNCQRTIFADSFLVYQKLITALNSILGVSPSIDTFSFIQTQLALRVVRENADCVIHSFFNFLNQCAAEDVVGQEDLECVNKYTKEVDQKAPQCSFAVEDGDSWNIPSLVSRYGIFGAEEALKKFKASYMVSEVSDVMRELHKVLLKADSSLQGVQYLETMYDEVSLTSSVNVCPTNFVSLNYNEDFAGTEIEQVAFHFPISEELDPIYNATECDTKCSEYFDFTKTKYLEDQKKVEDKEIDKIPYFGPRCYYIVGYDIKFLESGKQESLSYEKIQQSDASSNQCFKASWNNAKSCSSHLSEWSMTVKCCKSYHDIVKENEPTPTPTPTPGPYRKLLNEGIYYHPTPAPTPKVVKIDPKDLQFDKTVVSSSTSGSLRDELPHPEDPSNVKDLIDSYISSFREKCADNGQSDTASTYHGTNSVTKEFLAFCDRIDEIPRHLMAENTDPTNYSQYPQYQNQNLIPLPNNYYLGPVGSNGYLYHNGYHHEKPEKKKKPVTYDYQLKKSYYVGDSTAKTEICKELNIDLNFDEIVPLVSSKCYPQACVLSQLAACLDEPEANYDSVQVNLPKYFGHTVHNYYNGHHGHYYMPGYPSEPVMHNTDHYYQTQNQNGNTNNHYRN